jgi:hypothetical protein
VTWMDEGWGRLRLRIKTPASSQCRAQFKVLALDVFAPHRYCDPVKNITLSIEDDLYRLARRKAAEMETSVSGLVRNYFRSLADEENRLRKVKARMERLFAETDSAPHVRTAGRTDREEIYAKRVR